MTADEFPGHPADGEAEHRRKGGEAPAIWLNAHLLHHEPGPLCFLLSHLLGFHRFCELLPEGQMRLRGERAREMRQGHCSGSAAARPLTQPLEGRGHERLWQLEASVRPEHPSTSTSVAKRSSQPRSLGRLNGACTSFCRPRCADLTRETARGHQKVPAQLTPPKGRRLWAPGPPPPTSAHPRSSDGLFRAPREAIWKTEPPRGKDAAGSQGFEGVMLSAYGLTSPLLSHSSPTAKQEEDERRWNANHGIPHV